MAQPEAWLRGPVEGIAPVLMPAAHALIGAAEDIEAAISGLTPEELWTRPGGAASAGFHAKHAAGALDRLLTYARGEALSDAQRAALEAEKGDGGETAEELVRLVRAAVERALAQLRATDPDGVFAPRGVGRMQLPSSVLGLLFHAAEHTQRHTGQVITTAKVVRRLGAGRGRGGGNS
jgi:uncharacterized damage-inducible protein DinB